MWFTTVALLSLLLRQPPVWQLHDQFGQSHTSHELVGKPVLLIGGGSAAGSTFDAWVDAIANAYGVSRNALPFTVVGIADVAGAPRIVYPLIRMRLPRDRRIPVLVDPNGEVARQYGIERANSNQLVLGPDGAVLLHVRGIPVDTAQARQIALRLKQAVELAAASARSR